MALRPHYSSFLLLYIFLFLSLVTALRAPRAGISTVTGPFGVRSTTQERADLQNTKKSTAHPRTTQGPHRAQGVFFTFFMLKPRLYFLQKSRFFPKIQVLQIAHALIRRVFFVLFGPPASLLIFLLYICNRSGYKVYGCTRNESRDFDSYRRLRHD